MACPLCDQDSGTEPTYHPSGTFRMVCPTCGTFDVEDDVLHLQMLDHQPVKALRYRLSAQTKASTTPLRIDKKSVKELRDGWPRDKSVPEKIELMIRWFAAKSTQIGEGLQTVPEQDYPAAWCRGPTEWRSLLTYVCTPAMNLLSIENPNPNNLRVLLLVDGWRLVEETKGPDSAKVFIAMAFDPALNGVKTAIHKAIEGAGYEPLRVDDDHYSGSVMDRIIMHIRDSKFIVADFTGNRGGVYYEAGVAFGLGIDVVNVCEDGCLVQGAKDQLHFDVRHLVFVPWKAGELEKFSEELRTHIIAVHGRGPRSPTA